MIAESNPINLFQFMKDSNWLPSMQEEIREIKRNKIWKLVDRSNKKAIDIKWDYKLKLRPNCDIFKYKSRIAARGFLLQKPGIDFNEVYAPFTRFETIRIVVAITTYKRWKMHQLDVNLAFMNEPLDEYVYVK